MTGVHLAELPATDMLDILHHMFEEDHSYQSEAHMKSKLKMRETVYEKLYGQPFKYGYKDTSKPSYEDADLDEPLQKSPTQDLDDIGADDGITPFKPREQQPTKAYIQPTQFDPEAPKPFGNILDAPLG